MDSRTPRAAPSSSASVKPRRRRIKVVDEIIETLRQEIVTRRLPHGARLPSEKELSERFGVSQPTVREAIRALETLGLVEVFHGNGSFVRSQGDYALASALQTLLQLKNVGIMDVLDIRQVLGRQSIEAAALRATPDDVAAIKAASDRFDRLGDLKEIEEVIACIIDFQRIVSATSGNPILQSLEAFLLALLNEVQINSLTGRSIKFWRARAMEFQPHRLAILAGVASGDPTTARKAIDMYFEAQRARFDHDEDLRASDLSSPKLVAVVSELVRQYKD